MVSRVDERPEARSSAGTTGTSHPGRQRRAWVVMNLLFRMPRADAHCQRLRQCCSMMLASEGAGAFFYGLAPTVIRSLPNLGIQFLIYETLKVVLGFSSN